MDAVNAVIEIAAMCLVPYLFVVAFRDRSRVRIRIRARGPVRGWVVALVIAVFLAVLIGQWL